MLWLQLLFDMYWELATHRVLKISMIVFFSDSCFSNSKILFLWISTYNKLADVTALPVTLLPDRFENCIPIIGSSTLRNLFSTLSHRSLNFLSITVDTSFTSCSFGIEFVAVSHVEMLASVSSRVIVSSGMISSGVCS